MERAPHAPKTSAVWRFQSEPADAPVAGGPVTCDVHYLGWQDIAQKKINLPIYTRFSRGVAALAELIFGGSLLAMARQNWPTALFILYPTVMLLALILLSVLPIIWLALNGLWLFIPPALIWPYLLLRFTFAIDKWTYFWYLATDLVSIRDFALSRDQAMSDRLDEFTEFMADLLRRVPASDEVILCGHSSGSIIGVRILDQLFTKYPDIAEGRMKKPVFLSLGSGFGTAGYFSGGAIFDEAARVANAGNVLWTDFHALADPICCGRFDPVGSHKIAMGKISKPNLKSARFGHMLSPEDQVALKGAFFEYHFGYLKASYTPGEFDLYHTAIGNTPWATYLRASEVSRYA